MHDMGLGYIYQQVCFWYDNNGILIQIFKISKIFPVTFFLSTQLHIVYMAYAHVHGVAGHQK